MWCLPTHGRPEKLARLVASMGVIDRMEPVSVMMWMRDPRLHDYMAMDLPHHWIRWYTNAEWCGEKMNEYFYTRPSEPFYGLLTDDVLLETPGMLAELRKQAGDWFVAWPNDGIHGPRLSTHPCCGGNLVRAMGYWAHPMFKHNGLDVVIYRLSEAMGLSRYCSALKLGVYNELPQEHDATYEKALVVNSKAASDMYAFQAEELPLEIQRVRHNLEVLHG